MLKVKDYEQQFEIEKLKSKNKIALLGMKEIDCFLEKMLKGKDVEISEVADVRNILLEIMLFLEMAE